jgi:hypothetical protein
MGSSERHSRSAVQGTGERSTGRGVLLVLLTALPLLAISVSVTCAADGGPQDPGTAVRPGPMATGFPLRFDSELIRLTILGDSLEIDGTYYLACQIPFERPISLFYPFPTDSLLAGARMVDGRARVGDGAWEALRYQAIPGRDGVRWWVPPSPGDTITLQGRYRQAIREKYARYIVTTTRAWQQPLRHARFEIRLPAEAKPVEFSFPFAEARDSTGVVYVWETDSFFPDRDITVRWK